jgi:hypothetical protein
VRSFEVRGGNIKGAEDLSAIGPRKPDSGRSGFITNAHFAQIQFLHPANQVLTRVFTIVNSLSGTFHEFLGFRGLNRT